jgi:hypothetical protein
MAKLTTAKRNPTPLRTLQAPTAPFPSKMRLPSSLPRDWLAVPLNLGSSHPLDPDLVERVKALAAQA